jgi:hypothetical protein
MSGEHIPGCNVGCEGESHYLIGDEAEAWWQAIVAGRGAFGEFADWLAERERAAAEKALRDAHVTDCARCGKTASAIGSRDTMPVCQGCALDIGGEQR